MRRLLPALFAVAATLVAAQPASASAWGGTDPKLNIAPSPTIAGSVCDTNPRSDACSARLLEALSNARHHNLGSTYTLPSRFGYLSVREKMLVLASADRVATGLSPLRGLNGWLDANAQAAVRRRDDPRPVDYVAGTHWTMWTANWAGGNGATINPLMPYYDWMYYDGLNANGTSWNLLCSLANRTFCWKHRHNVLAVPGSGSQLALGVGGGPDGHGLYGWTQLVEAFPASAPIGYVPTMVSMTHHWAPHAGGAVITLGGFGFVRVEQVTVNGKTARVLSADPWHLKIRVPSNTAGSNGYIVVRTSGGSSSKNYAAQFQYTG
jgi:hypothetical protein